MMVVAEIYCRKEQYDPRCITKLVRNFWSHPALLEVLGRLFYHGELLLYADKVIVNSCLVLPPEFHEPCGFYEPPG